MIGLGPYRLDLISDGLFEDDADTFVRECAERHHAPGLKVRGKSRVKVGFNGLLVRGAGRTVVIDPGTGDKPRLEMRRSYNLEWPRRFLPALAELGVRCDDVDTVILTHLHWDHCGAATQFDNSVRIIPTFANARYYVQSIELDAARAGNNDGYNPDDFEPLAQSGRLFVIEDDGEVIPGFEVRRTGGHSGGHQIVLIGNSPSARAVFLSDLIPTSAQLPLDCGLSYDTNPSELRIAKEKILREAAAHRYLLMFVHAPRTRAGYLESDNSGRMHLRSITI